MESVIGKSQIRTFYAVQHQRISIGNKICAEVKVRLGQLPGMKEDGLEEEAKEFLKKARKEYNRLTDALVFENASELLSANLQGYEIITDTGMLVLVREYVRFLEAEEENAALIKQVISDKPLWTKFLKDIKGVGPIMTAIIMAELNPHLARYAQCFWKYAGLDVAEDGHGRSRRQEHLVMKEYKTKKGTIKKKKSLTFNPFLKTKLLGVLGSSFLRQKPETCKYRRVYEDYKFRLENHAVYGVANDATRIEQAKKEGRDYHPKGHRNRMAIRYMIKIFLLDLWMVWRELEGLPITEPYAVAVLHRKRHNYRDESLLASNL